MGILGSVSRYLRTYGRLLYADPQGFARPMLSSLKRGRKKKNSALSAYMDMLEPRVLMTTVYGGDTFRYLDARGNTVTATLSGNIIAELVGAVELGGTTERNLILGDIVGTLTGGARNGVIVGNGSVPVNNGTQGTADNAGAHIRVTGAAYPNPQAGNPGNQVNLQTVASNASGQIFTFNIFNIDPDGTPTISPLDVTSKGQDFTLQIIQLNSSSMAGTPVYTVRSDQAGSPLPMLVNPLPLTTPLVSPLADTRSTFTYTEVGIKASAFNPLDNKLYFDLHYQIKAEIVSDVGTGGQTTTTTTTTYVDEIFKFDPTATGSGLVPVSSVVTSNRNVGGVSTPTQAVTGMTFVVNASNANFATLYISEEPVAGVALPQQTPQLLTINVNSASNFSASAPTTVTALHEGTLHTGNVGRDVLNGLAGLASLPASIEGGGANFLFGNVNNGANSHVVRINISNGESTIWGNTTDLYEAGTTLDGRSMTGFTFNPVLQNPFNNQQGSFLTIDLATTNLDFVNHKLRINAGDVYASYVTNSDINASMTFQGQTVYTGDSGDYDTNTPTPANTGTVFIGYKGSTPQWGSNTTYFAVTPITNTTIAQSLGVMPGIIQDISDPQTPGGDSRTLFAGLDVTRTLQQSFNANGSLTGVGSTFRNVTGMAVSPTGQIALVNTFYFNGSIEADRLGLVNQGSSTIGTAASFYLNGNVANPLHNIQALTYGDPNLDGTWELYAVVDLNDGSGPRLGTVTVNGTIANFTAITALGLGAHGKVAAISFTPGGTAGDPGHQSLYVVADPNNLDLNGSQYLYVTNMTFSGGGAVTAVNVASGPTYTAAGNLATPGGLGIVRNGTSSLNVVAMVYDTAGVPLVFDRSTSKLYDLNLTTALAGANFSTEAGELNATVAGIVLDPVTLQFVVADNATGVYASPSAASGRAIDIPNPTASAILMKLRDFDATDKSANLGRFLVDGTLSGQAVVPGSSVVFYAGWVKTNIVYFAGDARNVIASTNLEGQLLAEGRLGMVRAGGNITAGIHAADKTAVPGLMDLDPLNFNSPDSAYSFSYRGSAETYTSDFMYLTYGPSLAGSVFSNDVRAIDSFTASFTANIFSITNSTTSFDGGFAFVLQNQGLPALGASGSGLGYVGIQHSAALGFKFNPVTDQVTLQLMTNGVAIGQPLLLGTANVLTAPDMNVQVTYSGNTLLVSVASSQFNATASYTIDLATILGSHAAYVGFTGGSGTAGSASVISNFNYNGSSPSDGVSQVVRNFINGGGNFADGFLSNLTWLDSTTIDRAQYLPALRNSADGQPDVMHLKGSSSAAGARFYAFPLLAGQTVDVSVVPDTTGGNTGTPMDVQIYDPDGHVIATNMNWFSSSVTAGGTIRFTADRPGVYKIGIGGPIIGGSGNFDLRIKGAGNLGITAVAADGGITVNQALGTVNGAPNARPGIWAESGDIGVVLAGGAVGGGSGGTLGSLTLSGGYSNGTSSRDIYVPAGNLRVLSGGSVGAVELSVSGSVGLLQTTAGDLNAGFAEAIGKDIQVIEVAGAMHSVVRTNRAIGVVRAASAGLPFTAAQASAMLQAPDSMLQVDADRTGSDGTIDFIDVSGDWNGTPIVSGPGGNVRFMRVGGVLYQDPQFETSLTPSNDGAITWDPGPVTFTDDSGAVVTLTPSSVTGTDGTLTSAGTLTTRTFGVRGAGGVIILDVTSTTGITVNAAPGGSGRNICDIGTIVVQGAGVPITVVNGVPQISTASGDMTDVVLTASGAAVINAYDIRNDGTAQNPIDHITNTTAGDIVNVNASDVGFISSRGNVGTVTNTTGAALVPLNANFGGGTYPFDGSQFAGVSVNNVGSISAGHNVGNVNASGVIGTITANAGGVREVGKFYGINGLVVASGSENQTSNTTTIVNGVATAGTLTRMISISNINIGQGIAFMGSSTTPHTGVYATGRIVQISGNNGDIRGNVVSTDSIGSITLTDGSIINSQIAVYSQWDMASSTFNNVQPELPNPTTVIDKPQYVIDSINVQGKGGILASYLQGSSINNVVVGASGFGILGTYIQGVDIGTIHSVSAGGYGIMRGVIMDARVDAISATGTGAQMPLTTFDARLRTSVTDYLDTTTGSQPNALNDLGIFMLGDGILVGPVRSGLTTGVIFNELATGKDRLGTVSAYDIYEGQFTFPVSTGAINVRNEVDDTQFLTGKVASLTVGKNATNLELTVAGQIGPVNIGGFFGPGSNSAITSLSQIIAKGANGNITSVTIKGGMGGFLLAEGSMGNTTIGTAGTTGNPGSGDVTGTITVGSNHLPTTALTSLKIYGSVLDAAQLHLSGIIGTIDVGGSINVVDDANLVINGSVSNLIVGSDQAVTGSDIVNRLTILGNLTNATITGQLSGGLIVQNNLSKFVLNSDSATVGNPLLSGELAVGGTLASGTVSGSVSGNIDAAVISNLTIAGALSGSVVGGRGITTLSIGGNVEDGGLVSSILGDIKTLTIKGTIAGGVSATDGALTTLNITGGIAPTGSIAAKSTGGLSIPGVLAGSITVTGAISSLKAAGGVASTAFISARSLASLTAGDLNGVLNITGVVTATKATVNNFGAQLTTSAPLSLTVNGSMAPTSMIVSTNALTSLAVKGVLSGQIVVDRLVGAVSAASMSNAVITAGLGLSSVKVSGVVNNSLVSVGLTRGADGVFGTDDLNEQARMGDLGSFAAGSMNNSLVVVGGNVGNVSMSGNMSSSAVASGLVLKGSSIAAIMADGSPLADASEVTAALQNTTLLHGNINSVTVGKTGTTVFASSIAAGVSPGADGNFGTSDDNVNTSLTGGVSVIGSFKGTMDGSSHLVADGIKSAIAGLTRVGYTTGSGGDSILSADPIIGAPTLIVTSTTPGTLTTGSGTIIVKVTGTGATVALYDDPLTTDRLDTLLISSTLSNAVSVTVTTSDPNAFGIGRVIATDDTVVSNFAFNGDILGDAAGGPALWLDSDMSSFSIRNTPNDTSWSGVIGGNVSKMAINQMGPGALRIGGRVATFTLNSNVGTPLVQQLGVVTPATAITQVAFDSSGNAIATDGVNLLNVDILTGSISGTTLLHTLNGGTLSLSGLAYDGSDNLYGVATLNNLNPINLAGSISTGDTLHGLAVTAGGTIYAIDSQSGVDRLVIIDPVTGAKTFAGSVNNGGLIRDNQNNTFSGNITALTVDASGNLLALLNDRDGSGNNYTSANGYAVGRLFVTPNGLIRMANPLTSGASGDPVLINGSVTHALTAMAINATGGIYVVENLGGGVQQLDRLTIGSTSALTTLTAVGNITLGATNTNLVGIGIDETGAIVGMNVNGSTSELVAVNATAPTLSVRIDAQDLLQRAYGGFAIGRSGTHFTSYGYTTDSGVGGEFFVSPGVTSTLGSIGTDGGFTQLLPLSSDADGTPLTGTVTSVAVDASGNIFAITDDGILAEYSAVDGSIIGGEPIGAVKDSAGNPRAITRISFNAAGQLVGISSTSANLMLLSTTSSFINGENVALATDVTELGTVDATDLTALAFNPTTGQVISYSNQTGAFVQVLGVDPDDAHGIFANSFGSVNLPASFSGHLKALGGGGTSVQGIDTVKLIGAGAFSGDITAINSIGAVSGAGIDFSGAIVSHADIKSVSLTGGMSGGVIGAEGVLSSLNLTGDVAGAILTRGGASYTVKGSILSTGIISVNGDLTGLSVSGGHAGIISLGSVKTLTISGMMSSGAIVFVDGVTGTATVSGGVQLGALLQLNDLATTVTIGGMLSGVVEVRKSLNTANVASASAGVLAVGQDLNTLNITGNASNSVFASGVWLGDDGIYNTADDVIYGGSVVNLKVGGVFTNSIVTAGVLPPISSTAADNNIPTSFAPFNYNPLATTLALKDGAETGGIGTSSILNVTFSKAVVSTATSAGIFSGLIAADAIGKVNSAATTLALVQILRNDPTGQPLIPSTTDPDTLDVTYQVQRISTDEIWLVFNQPLNTATIDDAAIQVVDNLTLNPVADVTLDYARQTAADGTVQGVVKLISSSHFGNAASLTITINPSLLGVAGQRSGLLLYANDPFGVAAAANVVTI